MKDLELERLLGEAAQERLSHSERAKRFAQLPVEDRANLELEAAVKRLVADGHLPSHRTKAGKFLRRAACLGIRADQAGDRRTMSVDGTWSKGPNGGIRFQSNAR